MSDEAVGIVPVNKEDSFLVVRKYMVQHFKEQINGKIFHFLAATGTKIGESQESHLRAWEFAMENKSVGSAKRIYVRINTEASADESMIAPSGESISKSSFAISTSSRYVYWIYVHHM